MYETECRGCVHAAQHGYFLYCDLTDPMNMQPAKVKCSQFKVREIVQKRGWF